MTNKTQWNLQYCAKYRLFGNQVNPLLLKYLPELPFQAKILNIGDGEGFNSIYAAKQRYQVTSLDSAVKAQIKAQENARKEQCVFELVCADILDWQAYSDQFELITVFFVHVGAAEKALLAEKIHALLKPGGLLLFECFHKHHLNIAKIGPTDAEQLYDEQDIAALFPGFDILKLDANYSTNSSEMAGNVDVCSLQFVGRKK